MAYTPTVWNTGDTITAEKLNKLENGVTSAQVYTESEEVRFSGEVTTEASSGFAGAEIECDLSDTPEQITVVFDGTEYTVNKVAVGSSYGYGSFINGPDFSQYPFFITFDLLPNPILLFTETAGTHQVEIESVSRAVNQDLIDVLPVMRLEHNKTLSADAIKAFNDGKLLYYTGGGVTHIVTDTHDESGIFGAIPEDHYTCSIGGEYVHIGDK